ncbi:MAG: YdeI/OmpD-associated family protein [Pseudomonadota bacterium]
MGGIATEKFEKLEVTSAKALRAWLSENHGSEDSIWLVTHKKHMGETYVDRFAVLDELVAFGWIDGIRRVLDADRTMQLISKRKTQHWSQSYKDRAAKLIEEGRMADPGFKSIEEGKASGLWDFMADVDALIQPDDLKQALAGSKSAQNYFDSCPDAYVRNVLRWIKLAKTDATRSKRIQTVVATSQNAERIPQM